MINGLGIVGWGVGGIEAEAGMLGQPVYFLTPDVVGVHLTGELPQGATATDLVLRITEMLRKANVVGKFVEFFGEGAAALNATDRATIANMAPEYGATMGFFPIDEKTLDYFANTGRPDEQIETIRNYYTRTGNVRHSAETARSITRPSSNSISIRSIRRSPGRNVRRTASSFRISTTVLSSFLQNPSATADMERQAEDLEKRYPVTMGCRPTNHATGGGEQSQKSAPESIHNTVSPDNTNVHTEIEMMNNRPTPDRVEYQRRRMSDGQHNDRQRRRADRGDHVMHEHVEPGGDDRRRHRRQKGCRKGNEGAAVCKNLACTRLACRHRVSRKGRTCSNISNEIGFNLVGYGCTTCIGNSGPLDPAIEEEVVENDIIAASVLSGNRNFEARVHQNIKANFLMSPPLVVAYALAGTVVKDVYLHPIGQDRDGNDVFLKDIWASLDEVKEYLQTAFDPETYTTALLRVCRAEPALERHRVKHRPDLRVGHRIRPISRSRRILKDFSMETGSFSDIKGARALAIFGDSVTTDHISPAGAIKANSPAGLYLQELGVDAQGF